MQLGWLVTIPSSAAKEYRGISQHDTEGTEHEGEQDGGYKGPCKEAGEAGKVIEEVPTDNVQNRGQDDSVLEEIKVE